MDIYNKLVELVEEIFDIYRNLYNIEVSGFKNTSLYEKRLGILKDKILEEDRLIQLLISSDEYENVRDIILFGSSENECNIRIKDYIMIYEGENVPIYEFDDEDTIREKNMAMNSVKIYNICAKNIFLIYGTLIDRAFEKLVIKSIKERLLRVKYYNCMVKHKMEEVYVRYNFNMPNDIYTDLDLMIDFMRVDEEFSNAVILDGYMTAINSSIEQLMSISDDSYLNDESLRALSLNFQCMLKACFALMNETDYGKVSNEIVLKMQSLVNSDNIGSIENIVDIMNNRDEYRGMVKRLSIRPRR